MKTNEMPETTQEINTNDDNGFHLQLKDHNIVADIVIPAGYAISPPIQNNSIADIFTLNGVIYEGTLNAEPVEGIGSSNYSDITTGFTENSSGDYILELTLEYVDPEGKPQQLRKTAPVKSNGQVEPRL